MIKKLIGLLAAAGIIAVLVFVVLNRNNYRSMLFDDGVSLLDMFVKSDPVADAPVLESPADFVPDAEYGSDAADSTAYASPDASGEWAE